MTASKIEKGHNNLGFTLIEIIVTIAISAILAVLLSQVMQGHSWRSYLPLKNYDQSLALREVTEEIAADYRNLLINDEIQNPLAELRNRINSDPPYYWNSKTFGQSIQVDDCYCFNFIVNGPNDWIEDGAQSDCTTPSDTLLKIKLSFKNQSLSTLFTR